MLPCCSKYGVDKDESLLYQRQSTTATCVVMLAFAQGFPQYLQQYDMSFRGSGVAPGQPSFGAPTYASSTMADPFILQVRVARDA